ncbi:hypothetical protein AOC36_09440 [Erysipelothrix larvae]|uniref:DAGKc domain-containing protein n=1 Tax=Erysipelothrix larvae TaxID=1514105 RepID=A0A0X8H161_9FIRM|nr:diacylglycerol kinase family protein [Erysipelothrix larvae]AMC94197.1 hypothetical protein AOC36_09440 [Erysipelothrix larvae]
MKHIFIINPNSGIGEYKEVQQWIEKHQHDTGFDYEVFETQYVGHATEIASTFDDPNVVLYSCGGDGTLHEVLNGIGLNSQLGVIPVGTSNDFWRMLNFSGNIDEILTELVFNGHETKVDIGVSNGERYLNCANFGLDACINRDVNLSTNTVVPRRMLYLYYAVKNIFKMKPVKYELEMNGKTRHVDAILTSIMNGRYYGNGFKSTPDARIDDGLFDVCVVDPISILEAFNLLPKYMKGTHVSHKKVHVEQTQALTIRSMAPILYGLDGEIFEATQLEFSIEKHALRLRVPRGYSS